VSRVPEPIAFIIYKAYNTHILKQREKSSMSIATFTTTVKNGLPLKVEVTHYTPGQRDTWHEQGYSAEIEYTLHWLGGGIISDKFFNSLSKSDKDSIEEECFEAVREEIQNAKDEAAESRYQSMKERYY
jgi:hypothetical protein